jgi:nucleoside-diphosphate-sugar epimerase
MGSTDPNCLPRVLVTGATGFLGHHVLRELLLQGRPCAAVVRGSQPAGAERLIRLLGELGIDGERAAGNGQLVSIHGDLRDGLSLDRRLGIGSIVHCAASTRFDADANGEPLRTNVDGTARLLGAASAAGVRELHLVGTAFVCGRTRHVATERIATDAPGAHNDYERSKWQAELLCARWAQAHGARLTLHRPSVIVGAFPTGRATKFDGFYVTARATELLERRYADADARARRAIPLRIKARPRQRQNIVPVDWVARMIAGIVASPRLRGRVYNLVHPRPPSNALIKRALERHFGIGGGRFVAPEAFPTAGLSDEERLFGEIIRPVEHYIIDAPRFARGNVRRAEALLGERCPAYDEPAIARLVASAQAENWGRRRRSDATSRPAPCDRELYANYFERFLPAHVGQSRVARATAMDALIRFAIGPRPEDDWLCRFKSGHLVEVRRACPDAREEFGYRSTDAAFWRAVSGQVHPQDLFLSGEAELFGDAERALKMVMILNAFAREFPCDRHTLQRFAAQHRRSA